MFNHRTHIYAGFFDLRYSGYRKANPREVSQEVIAAKRIQNDIRNTAMLGHWGQFQVKRPCCVLLRLSGGSICRPTICLTRLKWSLTALRTVSNGKCALTSLFLPVTSAFLHTRSSHLCALNRVRNAESDSSSTWLLLIWMHRTFMGEETASSKHAMILNSSER